MSVKLPENHPGLYSYTNDAGSKVNVALFGGVAMDNQMVYDILKNTAEGCRNTRQRRRLRQRT